MKLPRRHRGGHPFTRHALEWWLRSPRGRRFLALEERELRVMLPEVFGRHVLQVGSWGYGHDLVRHSEMMHRAVLGTVREFGEQAMAAPEHLPIQDQCVDGVLLPHALEFARSPHHVLREVNRILTDRGRLFILGFNPWSSWGLRQRLGLRYRAFPAGARFVSVGRLCDWLELLEFEVTVVRRYGLGFPWTPTVTEASGALQRWLGALSEGYLLVARKRVLPLTLRGLPQRAAVRAIIGGVTMPGAHTRTTR